MTRKEKIEYLTKAVMTLSELGDGKTAYALNEIRLEMKSQFELPEDLEEAANKFAVFYDQGTCDGIAQYCFKAGAEWRKAKMLEDYISKDVAKKIAKGSLGVQDFIRKIDKY